MIVRPVDGNGDMMPMTKSSQMLSGAAAVAQIVEQRLHFYYGEWWENRKIGIRIPDFLVQMATQNDASLIIKYIENYIANSPGVKRVTINGTNFDYRQLYFECLVKTDEGTEEVEVDLSALL